MFMRFIACSSPFVGKVHSQKCPHSNKEFHTAELQVVLSEISWQIEQCHLWYKKKGLENINNTAVGTVSPELYCEMV